MPTQKALQVQGPGEARVVSDAPIPKLRPEYILIKVHCIALNPTDWKAVDNNSSKGAICGCDYSGVVEEVGKDVTKPFKKGDRICGMVHGSNALNHEDGAFAEYIVAKGDIQMKVPDEMSFENAATWGVGIATVGQAMYQSLELPLPTSPSKQPFAVLIYGGSTATGTLAIQFAKLSGLTAITTCSPSNFSLVESLGAEAAFDYNSPDCATQIREHTSNGLNYAFDTISLPASAKICADALSSSSGCHYSSLLKVDFPRKDVKHGFTLAYTIMAEPKRMGPNGPILPAKEEDFEFAKMWMGLVEGLLAEGKVKVHPPSVRGKGLEGALEGMQEMREGKVSGYKLVYRVSETP